MKKAAVSKNLRRQSLHRRSDDVILSLPLTNMTGGEFERLMSLYFTDRGYKVEEVGISGKDGGVDLVITNRKNYEKTAVQLKCYADKKVSAPQIRELVGAKRNHDCILALMVTTSDLTADARREADERRIEYWHGAIVADKLKKWGKYKGAKR